MFRSMKTLVKKLRMGRWCWVAVLVASLGLPGCAQWNLRGSPFAEDESSDMFRQFRPREGSGEAWGASNKALQIERDVGYY